MDMDTQNKPKNCNECAKCATCTAIFGGIGCKPERANKHD